VETDKADMEMEALDAGALAKIQVQEGESAPVGAVIAVLSEDGAGVAPSEPKEAEADEPPASGETDREQEAATKRPSTKEDDRSSRAPEEAEVRSKPATTTSPTPLETSVERKTAPEQPATESAERQPGPVPERKVREIRESRLRRETPETTPPAKERVFASPVVKRMAEEHGIDLSQIQGSGPGGRIVKQDLETYASQAPPSAPRSQPQPQPEPAVPSAVPLTAKKESFSRMRATIAKRMAESMREIPHFYVTCEIDMSEAVRLRAALKASERVSADVTYTHFIIKAVALALEGHPRLNASFVEDGRELKAEINIGLAVSLDDGLIVPVLHGCNNLSVLEIATQANALVERARGGKPTTADLSGGTFTISNMGMLPIEHFTAIINPPQGAILAVGAIKERPVVRDGQVRVAHTMMATLSCDHRILDGVTGGQFLAGLKKLLENPVGLMV
ncbi:MAG: dihydrolipoamide acetyltransferase family protein, partial [Candidatus Binatia bacterium]